MAPSSTVENYLKTIYKAQLALPAGESLVPMGQLAAALSVAPGTATTMVKTLAESGLVLYEPYAGVRLTEAGERLAALVLRRHRLIELFLVQVMGMSWAEVHEEAEQLEHAVSDRLIERIDELLGHPAVDPHGDPIPDAQGLLEQPQYQTLLTCPLNTPVVVARVIDQDANFLRFVERHGLKPGQPLEVEARDTAGDSVQLRRPDDQRFTIGMRAASKLLVDILGALVLALCVARGASAQPSTAPPFSILDNSFLVEEAFNQEPGVFQNIWGFIRVDDAWELAFTQEWPLGARTHQLSYTVPLVSFDRSRAGCRSGLGDVLVHYRIQALTEAPGRPAVAPRLSLLLPSGSARCGRGSGHLGLQGNLPVSKQVHEFYLHANAGITASRRLGDQEAPARPAEEGFAATAHLAASLIWQIRPMVNLLVETLAEFEPSDRSGGRTTRLTIAPGLRGGWTRGPRQVVVGAALPVVLGDGPPRPGVFLYGSYELPFRR
jgi:DtxR family Mn-dependent transcriptional regulator